MALVGAARRHRARRPPSHRRPHTPRHHRHHRLGARTRSRHHAGSHHPPRHTRHHPMKRSGLPRAPAGASAWHVERHRSVNATCTGERKSLRTGLGGCRSADLRILLRQPRQVEPSSAVQHTARDLRVRKDEIPRGLATRSDKSSCRSVGTTRQHLSCACIADPGDTIQAPQVGRLHTHHQERTVMADLGLPPIPVQARRRSHRVVLLLDASAHRDNVAPDAERHI